MADGIYKAVNMEMVVVCQYGGFASVLKDNCFAAVFFCETVKIFVNIFSFEHVAPFDVCILYGR